MVCAPGVHIILFKLVITPSCSTAIGVLDCFSVIVSTRPNRRRMQNMPTGERNPIVCIVRPKIDFVLIDVSLLLDKNPLREALSSD